jgi:hypothetical protein
VSNPFEDYADAVMSAPRKRALARAELAAAVREQRMEAQRIVRRRHERERQEQLLAGTYKQVAAELAAALEKICAGKLPEDAIVGSSPQDRGWRRRRRCASWC